MILGTECGLGENLINGKSFNLQNKITLAHIFSVIGTENVYWLLKKYTIGLGLILSISHGGYLFW